MKEGNEQEINVFLSKPVFHGNTKLAAKDFNILSLKKKGNCS